MQLALGAFPWGSGWLCFLGFGSRGARLLARAAATTLVFMTGQDFLETMQPSSLAPVRIPACGCPLPAADVGPTFVGARGSARRQEFCRSPMCRCRGELTEHRQPSRVGEGGALRETGQPGGSRPASALCRRPRAHTHGHGRSRVLSLLPRQGPGPREGRAGRTGSESGPREPGERLLCGSKRPRMEAACCSLALHLPAAPGLGPCAVTFPVLPGPRLDDVAAVELPQGQQALLGAGPDLEGQSLLAQRELQEPVLQVGALVFSRV